MDIEVEPADGVDSSVDVGMHIETQAELDRLVSATKGGKPLIIKLCPPCRYVGPIYDELGRKYPDILLKQCIADPSLTD